MALDRTWYNTLVDDDGTNTVGSVWDKTDVDALMDAVDAALALQLPLTGGAISGALTIGGALTIAGATTIGGTGAGTAQPLELVGGSCGVALTSTANTTTSPTTESYVVAFLKDSAPAYQKVGAMAWVWADNNPTTGYASWNEHASAMVAGVQTDYFGLVHWGAHGAKFFPAALTAANAPGPGFVAIMGDTATHGGLLVYGSDSVRMVKVGVETAGGHVRTETAHALGLGTGGVNHITITSGGAICEGAITAAILGAKHTTDFNANTTNGLCLNDNASVSGAAFVYFSLAGTGIGSIMRVGATSAVAFNTTSDQRLKTDRGVATNLDALRAVTVHDFTWTASGTPDRGIFAQEAAAVFPRAITRGEDADVTRPWMADYSKFVPDLIVGWQQHEARLAALEARRAA
jgi:hypothetical protein